MSIGNTFCENISHGDAILNRSFWVAVRRYFAAYPIEPILNPIPSRLMVLGAITAIGHLSYYLAWTYLEPTAYESLTLRLFMAASGMAFLLPAFRHHLEATATKTVYVLLVFLQVPFFFFFMYLMNGADRNWLASAALIIVALFGLTDWRLALVLLALAVPAAGAAWLLVSPPGQPNPVTGSDVVIGSFAVIAGSALGSFSASTRQLRLKHSNEVMGILAHELRTPLSANGLLAEAILTQSTKVEQPELRKNLERLGRRVQAVTDSMNHHIDLQIINARMLRLPRFQDRICASELVQQVVSQYPFRSRSYRECVRIVVERDFDFIGSTLYFGKVLDNLIGNAIKSLQAAGSDFSAGRLVLSVTTHENKGILAVTDSGMGIEPTHLSRLFKPYFSTDEGGNHGLGLFFCKRVVEHANGTISVKSTPLVGARFEVHLPIANVERHTWLRPRSTKSQASTTDVARVEGSTGSKPSCMSTDWHGLGPDTVTQPLGLEPLSKN